MSLKLSGINPLAYMGVEPTQPPQLLVNNRVPTSQDVVGINIGTMWVDSTTMPQTVWMLTNVVNNVATWIQLYPASGGATLTLDADTGSAVAVAGVINVNGSININTAASGNTLDINLNESIHLPNTNNSGTQGVIYLGSSTFLQNYGVFNTFVGEGAGNLTLTTGSATTNSGFGTVTLHFLTTGQGNCAFGFSTLTTCGSGSFNSGFGYSSLVSIDAGNYNCALGYRAGSNYIDGSSNITISNIGPSDESNTIRIGTQGTGNGEQNKCYIAGIYGSTASATNSVAIVASDGSLGSSGTGILNGQIPIGKTSDGSASWATLTAGSNISIVNSGNQITISATGTGGTGTVNFATDSGTAAESGNTITIAGGLNINTSGAAATVTVNLDDSISLPNTNTGGTQGLYSLGSVAFLHNYGSSNTFTGSSAGNLTLTAANSCGYGAGALEIITSGNLNCAFGATSLTNCDIGAENSAFGSLALFDLVSGSNNIAVGSGAGGNYTSSESSNICIGNDGTISENHVIHIGTQGSGAGQQNSAYIAGIYNTAIGGTNQVALVDSSGKLGSSKGNNGQLLIGSTAGSPAWATLTAGANVTITNGANSITIAASGGGSGNAGQDSFLAGLPSGTTVVMSNLSSRPTYTFGTGDNGVGGSPLTIIFDNTSGAFYPGDGINAPAAFTAPATGVYQFTVCGYGQASNPTQSNSQVKSLLMSIITPAMTYSFGDLVTTGNLQTFSPNSGFFTTIAHLTIGDVVTFTMTFLSSGTTTVNLSDPASTLKTYISGYRIA